MKFYIATSLERAADQQAVKVDLEKLGHECAYDWGVHGSVQDQGIEAIKQVALAERRGVADADLVVVLLPGGKGTHTELGMALAWDKEVVIIGPLMDEVAKRYCCFYFDANVAEHFATTAEFMAWMRGRSKAARSRRESPVELLRK